MDSRNHLHREKMKYCMHKNELALNCGNALNDVSLIHKGSAKAYPSVVTNLGDMTTAGKNILLWLHHESNTGKNFLKNKETIRRLCQGPSEKLKEVLPEVNDLDCTRVSSEMKNFPYFSAQGYALGMAYASALSGDTVGTVLIGGMVTVMNGAFEMHAGQMVQWYFDFEENMFYLQNTENTVSKQRIQCGTRKQLGSKLDSKLGSNLKMVQEKDKTQKSTTELNRKEYHDRELGALDSYPHGGLSARKHNIFLPKPYCLSQDGTEHYADKIRIFAKCVNGARPHEMVDLMLMTQSL